MIDLRMGDCLHILTQLPDNSVDSIVTDPPYGLAFMGKAWDYDVPGQNIWEECFRVLKPGGHLLAFFGTRTYHRGVIKIEDAGFEIRDQIQWLYGSGFPKSHNLEGDHEGWGTALKPANEPICMARKPLEKGLTVAQNVLKWGTGALNIDGSRIGISRGVPHSHSKSSSSIGPTGISGKRLASELNPNIGRWPANVILDEVLEDILILKDNLPDTVYRVIQEFFDDYSEMQSLRDQYSNLPKSQKSNEVLQQGMLLQGSEFAETSNGGKEAFSKIDQQNEGDEVADRQIREGKSDLQGQLYESRVQNDKHFGTSGTGADSVQSNVSNVGQDLLSRASNCDGEISRKTVEFPGSSSSHERNKNRQSHRKSRITLSESTQEGALGSNERSHSAPTLVRESDLPEVWKRYFSPSGLEVRTKDCAAKALDEQSGNLKSGKPGKKTQGNNGAAYGAESRPPGTQMSGFGDSGGASRFFYVAKASKSERNAGLEGMEEKRHGTFDCTDSGGNKLGRKGKEPTAPQQNFHPTVKPIKLMSYLINLVTPPGGIVLDCFLGSGTTGVAAKLGGFSFIGIERDPDYFAIAQKRIENAKPEIKEPDPQLEFPA